MSRLAELFQPGQRRAAVLAGLILILIFCAVFFIIDVIEDFRELRDGGNFHTTLEALATATLCAAIILMMLELREMLRRMDSLDRGIRAARGDMALLIKGSFDTWGLTPSEREVALLILKGFDNDAIARLRNVAAGTVRAQSARIYDKAGVDGRAQLFSLFMEELLADEP